MVLVNLYDDAALVIVESSRVHVLLKRLPLVKVCLTRLAVKVSRDSGVGVDHSVPSFDSLLAIGVEYVFVLGAILKLPVWRLFVQTHFVEHRHILLQV